MFESQNLLAGKRKYLFGMVLLLDEMENSNGRIRRLTSKSKEKD
jgi:hypothetical protein